ncbi:MAG: hypothetical protein M1826_001051 [Phylliscum demangeonii]|nr:MAG: hypothetical protein M1826_001051 [Phylliscum demangeonii]
MAPAPQKRVPLAANVLGDNGHRLKRLALDDRINVSTLDRKDPLRLLMLVLAIMADSSAFRIWHNWRRKKTQGLPGAMMFLWALSSVLLGTYALVQHFNLPSRVEPHIACVLSLVCWAQTMVYEGRHTLPIALLITVATGVAFAVFERVLVWKLQVLHSRGTDRPLLAVGILSAVMVSVALLPAYWEIWKRKGRVVGINFIFLTLDAVACFFTLLAIATQETFDALGAMSSIMWYVITSPTRSLGSDRPSSARVGVGVRHGGIDGGGGSIVLEIGIFASHGHWRYRHRAERHAARRAGLSYDDYCDRATPSNELPLGATAGPAAAAAAVDVDRDEERGEAGISDGKQEGALAQAQVQVEKQER